MFFQTIYFWKDKMEKWSGFCTFPRKLFLLRKHSPVLKRWLEVSICMLFKIYNTDSWKVVCEYAIKWLLHTFSIVFILFYFLLSLVWIIVFILFFFFCWNKSVRSPQFYKQKSDSPSDIANDIEKLNEVFHLNEKWC